MVCLCSFCVHYTESSEEDRLVCRCEHHHQEVHRWYVARKTCFQDRRKSSAPFAGVDRRRQLEVPVAS